VPLYGPGVPGITCVANAATFEEGPIAPGELVTLFGLGIGPDQALTAGPNASGDIGSSLGGLSVYFNGVAAPLLYVSTSQINAVVPFEISGATTSSVLIGGNGRQIQYTGLSVVSAYPAIFPVNGSGFAILNQDRALNSQNNPAAAGSVVSAFGTGAGLMMPLPRTGSIGSGDSMIAAPVSIYFMIPGRLFGPPPTAIPAEVIYAGDAPGQVEGVFQINFRIPIGLPAGSNIVSLAVSGEWPYTGQAALWIK
jgi:uncharacterized protein (TIGR03437 family)